MDEFKESWLSRFKSANLKRAIKIGTLLLGFVLIVFVSFFYATLDFTDFNWGDWGANSAILVGIMIFGVLIGNSMGTDFQKERVNGLYQQMCIQYNEVSALIENIAIFFSQFWIWYKERKLKEKKVEYLVENQFDMRVATAIVENIEKEDLEPGKFIYDGNEKIFVKEHNGKEIKFKKLDDEQAVIVKKIYTFTLDTFGDSYYLSLYDDGDKKVNEAEIGKKISQKIARDKRNAFILRIIFSLLISIVWSALSISEFAHDDPNKKIKAWFNLISRIFALISSFITGYSTSVINVRDQARAIENKISILKRFKTSYDNKMFIPETYEQMIEREYKEQIANKVVEQTDESDIISATISE